MVDKKVSQKQQVKQTVKVIIGDVAKKRVKRKRAVKKGSAKAQVITFIQGSASGSYVPGSNTPYNPSTQLPVATGTEVRTKILEVKGDNPPLNLSGSLSLLHSLQILEKNSMASNEGFPSKKMKQDEFEEAKRAGTLVPLIDKLGQVNVNMLDRNIPYIDDVRKAELKAKEQAFKKARQESIKRQVLDVMDRAITIPLLPRKTKKKLLIEDF